MMCYVICDEDGHGQSARQERVDLSERRGRTALGEEVEPERPKTSEGAAGEASLPQQTLRRRSALCG
jgi:hypothetical protein